MDATKAKLKRFIVDNFYVPEGEALEDGASLRARGIVDSTGVLEIVEFIEGTFGIRVEEEEIAPINLDSIDAIAAFVSRRSVEVTLDRPRP
jgi:acyl carrier protein